MLVIQEDPQILETPGQSSAEQKGSAEDLLKDADTCDNLPKPEEPELPPAVPVSEISVQAEDGPVGSLSSKTPATAARVTSATSVSHDLPTPPLSEGGDDVESKELRAETAQQASQEPVSLISSSKQLQEETLSSLPSSRWIRKG